MLSKEKLIKFLDNLMQECNEERWDHKEGTEQYGENSGWYECCAWIQQFIERGDFDEDK